MSLFHKLTVTYIRKTTRDAVVLTLEADEPEVFSFVQGQYLTFRAQFDGEELRRSYSICSNSADGNLQVAIKQVDGGAFSTWANNELKVGDRVEAMPPMGKFFAENDAVAPHIVLFAAGSGITPILSILHSGLLADSDTSFTLVYGNRNSSSIMFREELEDLKNRFLGRLSVLHILTDDSQDIDLFSGRIDEAKCEALFAKWIDPGSISMAFICGPEPMMVSVSNALQQHGLTKEQIRYELFTSAQPGRAKTRAKSASELKGDVSGRVVLNGETRDLVVDRDTSLLETALQNSVDAPFACKAGVCSTCKAKVLEGDVEMLTNHALEDYEVDAGFVLTCQCYALSERVIWDYDQAGH